MEEAAGNGHLEIVQWLYDHGDGQRELARGCAVAPREPERGLHDGRRGQRRVLRPLRRATVPARTERGLHGPGCGLCREPPQPGDLLVAVRQLPGESERRPHALKVWSRRVYCRAADANGQESRWANVDHEHACAVDAVTAALGRDAAGRGAGAAHRLGDRVLRRLRVHLRDVEELQCTKLPEPPPRRVSGTRGARHGLRVLHVRRSLTIRCLCSHASANGAPAAACMERRSIFVNGIGAHYKQTEALCYLQAFTLQYFYLASYLWTACFAFHLYQIIVKRNEYPEKFLWIYRSIGWGLPGFVLLYLVLRQLTGHLGVGPADRRWCWIAVHEGEGQGSSTADPNTWQREGALQQLLLFYAPIGFVFVFNSAIYYRILRFLSNDPMAGRFKKKVVLYLVIFFLCSIWGVINRLVQYFGATHAPSKFLTVMECICDPLQPLLNALAYGTNKQSLEAYKERFCSSWFYASLPSSDDESGVDTTALLSNDEEPERQEKRFGFDLFHQKRSSSKAKKKKKGVYVSNDDFVDSPR